MYLHLGSSVSADTSEIIGVFDMDNATVSGATRDFLNRAQREGRLITVSSDLPKSVIVTDEGIYISPISARTLLRRARKPY